MGIGTDRGELAKFTFRQYGLMICLRAVLGLVPHQSLSLVRRCDSHANNRVAPVAAHRGQCLAICSDSVFSFKSARPSFTPWNPRGMYTNPSLPPDRTLPDSGVRRSWDARALLVVAFTGNVLSRQVEHGSTPVTLDAGQVHTFAVRPKAREEIKCGRKVLNSTTVPECHSRLESLQARIAFGRKRQLWL
jgi:hypothetical protein